MTRSASPRPRPRSASPSRSPTKTKHTKPRSQVRPKKLKSSTKTRVPRTTTTTTTTGNPPSATKTLSTSNGINGIIDLFSGVGGIGYGLTGIAHHTTLYCDIDPRCRTVLSKNMARGWTEAAPIVCDVMHTDEIMRIVRASRRKPEMVISSSACVGFSHSGRRDGLQHKSTGLFLETLKLIENVGRPNLLLFENSDGIFTSNNGDDYIEIMRVLSKMGYTVRWGVFKAYMVGAKHQRARWYCLAIKDNRFRDITVTASMFRHDFGTEPCPRMIPRDVHDKSLRSYVRARHEMLGNSVVPQCSRLAFSYLFTCGNLKANLLPKKGDKLPFHEWPAKERVAGKMRRHTDGTKRFPKFGIFHQGKLYALPELVIPKPAPSSRFKLVFDPTLAPHETSLPRSEAQKRAHEAQKTLVELTHPVESALWATPRKSLTTGYCNTFSYRCLGDLGTQIKFERGTGKLRGGWVNPEWSEWLMGYRKGWTDVPGIDVPGPKF